MKDTMIYIVTHKAIDNKINVLGYNYIAVGDKKDNFECEFKDNTMNNIADKNKSFCELTAQYWIWKNSDSTNVGLVHYRRFFYNNLRDYYHNKILSVVTIDEVLKCYDVILPKPIHLNCTTLQFYAFCQYEKDFINMGKIIKKLYPEYGDTFDNYSKQKKFSPCNMIITSKKIYDDYSKWMFNILFELEKETDISSYSDYEKRIYGFLSEHLINIYVQHNNLKVKYKTMELSNSSYVKRVLYVWKKRIRKCLKFPLIKLHIYKGIFVD